MRCGKPLDTCFALLYTTPVYLWCGQWDGAQDVLEQLVNHTHWPVLKPFHVTALAMQGALLIGREDTERGTSMVQTALQKMRGERQNVVGTFVACWMADGLTTAGRFEEALSEGSQLTICRRPRSCCESSTRSLREARFDRLQAPRRLRPSRRRLRQEALRRIAEHASQ